MPKTAFNALQKKVLVLPLFNTFSEMHKVVRALEIDGPGTNDRYNVSIDVAMDIDSGNILHSSITTGSHNYTSMM